MAVLSAAPIASAQRVNGFHVDYQAQKQMVVENGETPRNSNFNGFTLGYVHQNVLGQTNLVLEWGADFGMSFYYKNYAEYGVESTTTMMDLKVPVSIAYKFLFAGDKFGIMPLAGLDLGAWLYGQAKMSRGSNVQKTDVFASENNNRRFIFDFHVGAKVLFLERFFLEYRYEHPFVNLHHDNTATLSVRRHNVGVGFYF